LENFRSMFAPVVFSVARNFSEILAGSPPLTPSNYAGTLRVTSRTALLDLALVFSA
jgi:hypothetical protein